ncbi:MAG TPA: response regulator [Acidobacteriaceae bacterium]|jgi:DNA-binding response OmpR family regulator
MKQKVLVVDDDRLVADTLNLVFLANGFESEARYSAADGLLRARTFGPQLLLCDITMPEENGLQLVEKIQAEMPEVRTLMLTAYSSNAAKVDAHSNRTGRPLKVLNKPCRPEELLREAHTLLRSA